MAFKKKEVVKKVEPVIEPTVQAVTAPAQPVKKEPSEYVCIRKCFFNLRLFQDGDVTPYIAGIEDNKHFEGR